MIIESIKKFIEEAQKKALEKQEKYNNFINSIDDEIVKKAWFLPLKRWWANYKTHNLILDSNWNYIFKVSLWFSYIFIWFFSLPIVVTLISLIWYISLNFNSIDNNELLNYLLPVIVFSIFPIIFVIIFYFIFVSKIFDFQNWYFYNLKYQNKLYSLLNEEKYRNKIIPINQIHAIQIIKERVSTKNSSYNSYEFNLILKDSSRINVIDHGNLEKLKLDVEQIANRIWVKIWDITTIEI